MPRTQPKAAWPVRFRAGGPQDAERIREFINGLSPRSQYLRFFASVAPPSSGLLRALSGNGGADIVLALHRGRVVGHCMAADREGREGREGLDGWAGRDSTARIRTSDIGLVVADDWQQRGVGTALLRIAVARAAARGTGMLVMDVMPGNHRILGVLGRRWPDASRELTADSILIRARLTTADLTTGGLTTGGLTMGGLTTGGLTTGGLVRDGERQRDDASHPAA
jgi:GNAT superfamily N-acetyltransferase